MRKGKRKTRNRSTSFLAVPHDIDKARRLKIPLPGLWLALISMAVIAALALGVRMVRQIQAENLQLQDNLERMSQHAMSQNELIIAKDDALQSMVTQNSETRKRVDDLSDQYKKLADTVMGNKSGTQKTDRSGDRDLKTVTDKMSELGKQIQSLKKDTDSLAAGDDSLDAVDSRLQEYVSCMPTLFPVSGWISSAFGSRSDPFWLGSARHEGIDIASDWGTPVKASADGVVIYSGWDSGYGNLVTLDHGNGITTKYGHNSSLLVSVGKKVRKGDTISRVGSTGRSTGPHLHFEVRLNNVPQDPVTYVGKP